MEVPAPKNRFLFVDALRGVAAAWVVVFHIYEKNLLPMTRYALPEPLHSVLANGRLGVYIFFVISGFVIAYSVREIVVTPRFVAWFAFRRSVRLDPPYWATIAAMIALIVVTNHWKHDGLPVPTIAQVTTHLFYAQAFFGYPDIVGVFWTLCYEIQFYLALIILIGFWQSLSRRVSSMHSRWYVFGPLFALSLAALAGQLPFSRDAHAALALHAWPYFFLGVVVCWALEKSVSHRSLALVFLATLAMAPFEPLRVPVACASAVSILIVGSAKRLETMSLGRFLQYLGKISYSLYLSHMLVGTPVVRLGIRVIGNHADFLHSIALITLGFTSSVVAANVMYVLIERPAMRWSQRLRRARPDFAG